MNMVLFLDRARGSLMSLVRMLRHASHVVRGTSASSIGASREVPASPPAKVDVDVDVDVPLWSEDERQGGGAVISPSNEKGLPRA